MTSYITDSGLKKEMLEKSKIRWQPAWASLTASMLPGVSFCIGITLYIQASESAKASELELSDNLMLYHFGPIFHV